MTFLQFLPGCKEVSFLGYSSGIRGKNKQTNKQTNNTPSLYVVSVLGSKAITD